jgi:hypothetical protein
MTRAELERRLSDLEREVVGWFEGASRHLSATGASSNVLLYQGPSHWDCLTPDQRANAAALRRKVADLGADVLLLARSSALVSDADESDLRLWFRRMAAALLIQEYRYHDAYAIAEEDRVYGVQPAEQSESSTFVGTAQGIYLKNAEYVRNRLDFISFGRTPTTSPAPSTLLRSRPDTAFIMMQIDEENATLEDVKKCHRGGVLRVQNPCAQV